MKLLIICVDRDNDLGTKVGIQSPVVGRADVLNAAVTLGLADPEEADTNSFFAGLKVYDDYIKNGVDAEIAIICGDADVGIRSDQKLGSQIEAVLGKAEPTSAILVSDGAEDEYIYPLVSSRIKIDGIKRVVVKQARNIESLYYMFLRAFQEEKVRRRFVLPLALAFIVFSVFSLLSIILGWPSMSWTVVFLTLGVYIVIKAYNLDEQIKDMSQDAKTAISTIPFTILAIITIIAGALLSYNVFLTDWDPSTTPLDEGEFQLLNLISMAGILLWSGVFAVILLGIGRALHIYIKGNDFPWRFFPLVLTLLAFGSIMFGVFQISTWVLDLEGTEVFPTTIIFWIIGSLFFLAGYYTWGRIRRTEKTADWHQ